MPKTSLIFGLLCLFFLLPLSVFAQEATQTGPIPNCPYANHERSLVSGLFLSGETLAPTETNAYYFLATAEQLWRFDLSSIDAVTFNLHEPNEAYPYLSFSSNPSSIYSTVFRSNFSGMYCLYTSNQTEFAMQYNLRLTIMQEENGAFFGTEGLSTSEAYNWLGTYFYELGNYQSALNYYVLASETNPDDALAWSNRCAASVQLGLYNEAVEDCTTALNIDFESSDGLWYRGVAYESLGWYSSALGDYQTLQSLDPYESAYAFNVAVDYIFLGDAASALANMESYYNNSSAWFKNSWRGIAKLYAGDYQGAISDFESHIAQAQDNPYYAWFWIGISQRALGNRIAAEEAFANAGRLLQLENNSLWKHRWTALSLLVGGDELAARNHYRAILEQEPFAHLRRSDLLYITVLARVFPNERIYPDNLAWLRAELGME